MDFEQQIDYFSIFGGLKKIEFNYFLTLLDYMKSDFIENIQAIKAQIEPTYLLESPYGEVLMAIAKGDRKVYSSIKKAKINENLGEKIVNELIDIKIISLEKSKELELGIAKNYRIQSKLHFNSPFYRFWFGFVAPYLSQIESGVVDGFISNFNAHYERLRSLIFEQLSKEFLIDFYNNRAIETLFCESFWDKDNEFDIVMLTKKMELIVGECKYKDRKVCKNELTKLKTKAMQSGLNAKYWVLFSKQGFSEELKNSKDSSLLLFDLDEMSKW